MSGRAPLKSRHRASHVGKNKAFRALRRFINSCKDRGMRQSRSLSTRNRIIAAARELFLAQGLDGTSVAEVCRAAGVSNGALFHQFPTKEDLAFAVYTLVRREFWNQIIAAMIEPEDPLDGVEAAVRASFAFQLNDPDGAAFMFDVSGSKWIENFADQSREVYNSICDRGQAWANPHVAAGRLTPVPHDVFVALASGAPQ